MEIQNLVFENNETYYYDTPLTVKYETESFLDAGFSSVQVLRNCKTAYTLKA